MSNDREIKGAVYSETAIFEDGIVIWNQATVEVYWDPQSDSRFATVITARSGDTLKPRKVAGLSIEANAILS